MKFKQLSLTCVFVFLNWPLSGIAANLKELRNERKLHLDQTHEYLFAVDHLGALLYENGYDVVSSREPLSDADFATSSVILLHQSSTSLPYDESTRQKLVSYVSGGGGLYAMANSSFYESSGKRFPLEDLLEDFGVKLGENRGAPPLRTLTIDSLLPAFEISRRREEPITILKVREGAKPPVSDLQTLVEDSEKKPVAVRFTFGKGRVIVATDHSLLCSMSFPPPPLPRAEIHSSYMVSLFDWLSRADELENLSGKRRGGMELREPNAVISKAGLEVRYTRPLMPQATWLLDHCAPFQQALEKYTGTTPPMPLRVEVLATGGGAFCSGELMGIGALTEKKEHMRGFVLWEMTNAWPLPAPPSFTEAWATFLIHRLGSQLGVKSKAEAEKEWRDMVDIIKADDPRLDTFDVALLEPDKTYPGKPKKDRDWAHFRMLKAGYMLRELHDKFGDEFCKRLVSIHRMRSGETLYGLTTDFESFVAEASLAAGTDLSPYFRARGARFGKADLPETDEGIVNLARDLIRKDSIIQEELQRSWREAGTARVAFSDDRWMNRCTIRDNLNGGDREAVLIDSLLSPPDKFHYLKARSEPKKFADDLPRRGFTVLHPLNPTTPAKLSSKITIPPAGAQRLVVGGLLRPGGAPVTVALFIDQRKAWEETLRIGTKPFHGSIDLTPFAGKDVVAEVVVDSRGEWGSREVLIDYFGMLPASGN